MGAVKRWWSSPCRKQEGKTLRSVSRVLTLCIITVLFASIFLTKESTFHEVSAPEVSPEVPPEAPPAEPDYKVLVVTSSIMCDSKECEEKNWIRQNSFRNWRANGFDVLVLVDHLDDCEKFPEIVMCMKHDCWHDSLGLPKVGCLIQDSMKQYPEHIVVFTNDDMSFKGLDETIGALNSRFDQYAATGRRTNVPLDAVMGNKTENIYDGVMINIDSLPSDQLKVSTETELDYFVFRMGADVLDEYPEFLLGNWRWDNMMADYLIMKMVTMVDLSNTVTAYHIGKTSVHQTVRHGAKYNDDLRKTYLVETDNKITGDEGIYHGVIRFGSANHARYKTMRRNATEDVVEIEERQAGEIGQISRPARKRPSGNSVVNIVELLNCC